MKPTVSKDERRRRMHDALDRAMDELWTPNHSHPVPEGWRKLTKEAMAMAGRAQSAMGRLDKYWEPNKPGFAALRRINEAQRGGDEAKLRRAFGDLRQWLAKSGSGVALDEYHYAEPPKKPRPIVTFLDSHNAAKKAEAEKKAKDAVHPADLSAIGNMVRAGKTDAWIARQLGYDVRDVAEARATMKKDKANDLRPV